MLFARLLSLADQTVQTAERIRQVAPISDLLQPQNEELFEVCPFFGTVFSAP